MDIAAMSVVLSQSKVQMDASLLLTKKAMDISKDQSSIMLDDMKKTMELSVNPSVGGNIDIKL